MNQEHRYAVIDLGTNTFHILVVEDQGNGVITQLHKERIYVKLAEEGIQEIGEAPFQRALAALGHFAEIIHELGVAYVKAFGTAAIRTASNGQVLVDQVAEKIGIQIEMISGKEEARLIHKGVLQAIGQQQERIVIMDIGGGSVEFVIADNEKVYWSESFPIGVAVLFNQFHHQSPIARGELVAMQTFLQETLAPFFEAMLMYQAKVLVGASGTFDVLDIMMEKEGLLPYGSKLAIQTFQPLYDTLINTTLAERLSMRDIPDTRADMIIVALELIRFVIKQTHLEQIIVSSYAMKEGILKEMMEVSNIGFE